MTPPKDFTIALNIHTSRLRRICGVLMNRFKISICLLGATADISSCWIVRNPLRWYIALIYMSMAIAAIHHKLPQRPVAQNNLGSEETINVSFEEKNNKYSHLYLLNWCTLILILCLLCPMNPPWLLATFFRNGLSPPSSKGLKSLAQIHWLHG